MKKLYFGYGSNLDEQDWTAWCQAKGFAPSGIKVVDQAFLPDFQLTFDVYSPSRKCGVLNIRERRGHCVEGILFEVSAEGLDALDRKEGAPFFYRHQECAAILKNGTAVEAFTYEVCEHLRQDFEAPNDRYLGVCRRGRETHGLNIRTLDAAANGEEAVPQVRGLFVYGALLPDESRASVLDGRCSGEPRSGTVSGALVDLGDYPALLLEGNAKVSGHYLVLNDVSETLKLLDQIKRAGPRGGDGRYYRRTILPVEVGDGPELAWTYVLDCNQAANAPVISSG